MRATMKTYKNACAICGTACEKCLFIEGQNVFTWFEITYVRNCDVCLQCKKCNSGEDL